MRINIFLHRAEGPEVVLELRRRREAEVGEQYGLVELEWLPAAGAVRREEEDVVATINGLTCRELLMPSSIGVRGRADRSPARAAPEGVLAREVARGLR